MVIEGVLTESVWVSEDAGEGDLSVGNTCKDDNEQEEWGVA